MNIGSVGLIDKINSCFGFFDQVFDKTGGRARFFKESAKLFVANRLEKCVGINRLNELYSQEFFELLGFKGKFGERSLYRNLERIGQKYPVLLERYQILIKKHNLVSQEQFVDFSSSYFEGTKSSLGKLGYSRDSQPGKQQLTFGISTGINEIPSALTIQKGNLQDKRHMKKIFPFLSKILNPNSLLIFDCGANTKNNKKKIRKMGFHYLTLKPKKRTSYKYFMKKFFDSKTQKILMNCKEYECVKVIEEGQVNYVFFSKKLQVDQLKKKQKKFERELQKNNSKLSKVIKGKILGKLASSHGWIDLVGFLQKTHEKIKNPFITGLEGFFILESSIDCEPEKVLKLYKEKDKAEKLIRDMKEGTELRPIRHWSKFAVIGYLFIVFLTNCLISLTHFLTKNPLVKNLKVLKKYLNNLTLTVIYPKKWFRFSVLSNISPETESIFGGFLKKYEENPPDFRW